MTLGVVNDVYTARWGGYGGGGGGCKGGGGGGGFIGRVVNFKSFGFQLGVLDSLPYHLS